MPTSSPLVLLTLTVGIVAECPAVAADAPRLADLLAEYKELGLPLLPAKAKLVRYEAGGGGILNGEVQPHRYSLAFELQPGTKEEGPLLLQGDREWRPRGHREVVEAKPEGGGRRRC